MTTRHRLTDLKAAYTHHFRQRATAANVRQQLKADGIDLGHLDLRTTHDWLEVCEAYGLTDTAFTDERPKRTFIDEPFVEFVGIKLSKQEEVQTPKPTYRPTIVETRLSIHSHIWEELEADSLRWNTNYPVPPAMVA